jgi:hypothetical protein
MGGVDRSLAGLDGRCVLLQHLLLIMVSIAESFHVPLIEVTALFAGGKLISIFSTTDGPGGLVIIDVPDPSAAPAMTGIVVESGAIHNVKLTLFLNAGRNQGSSAKAK